MESTVCSFNTAAFVCMEFKYTLCTFYRKLDEQQALDGNSVAKYL